MFILLQNTPEGSVLLGAISYGKLSFGVQNEEKNPTKNPVSYLVSYNVPPNKVTTITIVWHILVHNIATSLNKVCVYGCLTSYFSYCVDFFFFFSD